MRQNATGLAMLAAAAALTGRAEAQGGAEVQRETLAQSVDPPATDRPPEPQAAGGGDAAFEPAAIPLVEIVGVRSDGQNALGIAIAPDRVVFAPGPGWGPDAEWTPGGHVRYIGTGEQAPIQRIVNWGGQREIEWAVLEVQWPDGAAPAPLPMGAEAQVGDTLRFVSWRDGAWTTFAGETTRTHCETCAHHIRYDRTDEQARNLRRGAPALTEENELAGYLYELSFGVHVPSFRGGYNLGYIPASRWAVESVEPVSQERFAEILRDQKAARAAEKRAITALSRDEWAGALAAGQEAVRLDPNLGGAWLVIGYTARDRDRDGVAAAALRNALRREEDPRETACVLASTLVRLRADEEAAQLALRMERQWPDDVDALRSAAYALLSARRQEDARRILQRILELEPEDEWVVKVQRRLDEAPEP